MVFARDYLGGMQSRLVGLLGGLGCRQPIEVGVIVVQIEDSIVGQLFLVRILE